MIYIGGCLPKKASFAIPSDMYGNLDIKYHFNSILLNLGFLYIPWNVPCMTDTIHWMRQCDNPFLVSFEFCADFGRVFHTVFIGLFYVFDNLLSFFTRRPCPMFQTIPISSNCWICSGVRGFFAIPA